MGIEAQNTCKYDDVDPSCEDEGVIIKEIFGGREADNSKYPYLVSIQQQIYEGCFSHLCGGTMISERLVLTAAHCFDNFVQRGEVVPRLPLYIAHNPKCRHQNNDQLERLSIKNIYINEDYDKDTNFADIAIALVYKDYQGEIIKIQPAQDQLPNALQGLVVGYGIVRPEEDELFTVTPLQEGYVSVMQEVVCNAVLSESNLQRFLDYKTMFCTSNFTTTTCGGDSGGPFLIQEDGGVVKQLGIVSWGPGSKCRTISDVQGPTVFTRLSSYQNWIQQILDNPQQVLVTPTPTPTPDPSPTRTSPDSYPQLSNSGTIAEEITALNNLEQLGYGKIGTIPKEISLFTSLIRLDLMRQGITGTLPSELSVLANLKVLYLHQNSLSGTIPAQLSIMTNLWSIRLVVNDLTGSIPLELSTLTNLQNLDLDINSLTGTIPNQLSVLIKLKELELDTNSLTGTIPDSISALTNLFRLELHKNNLQGTIPSELSALTNLEELLLYSNDFTGAAPVEFSVLTAAEIKLD